MKNKIKFLLVLFVWALFLCPAHGASGDDKTEKTFVLRQSSDALGQITTYINKSAVKILMPNEECYILTKAPTWKVVVYNAHNNNGLELPLAKWMQHQPRFTVGFYDNRFAWLVRQTEKLTWFGLPGTKYEYPCEKVNGVIRGSTTSTKGVYITVETPYVNEKTCTILEKALSVPQAPGLPLLAITKKPEIKRHEQFQWRTGGDGMVLRTLHKDLKDVPASFFTYPTGFTHKDLEVDVLMDTSRKQAIQDMVDHMESFDPK